MNLLFICGRLYANENTVISFRPSYAYKAHDYPMTLPPSTPGLPAVFLPVEESVHYPLLGDASDDAWYALTNWTNGFVVLGPEERLFAITMFHELHCLRILNLAYGDPRRPAKVTSRTVWTICGKWCSARLT
ncbi:uncharacterized protein LAESUDRAFT_760894 [Laetiporus sulphureus 93-53]|uniref:Uncharacterized protein n=1 Tax=Laetiporus sulphureus 93-53 TaxID=1314785 RepID=A0A165DCZ8_9APHY|nr:uncharacterized protein LAESUDRAFT_760894 [Laetiporus sulphureus 93-53]KZT04599.1 hypothetical protein LAESUDRAFT_760894 [Laetiporus sulphureus 93-53]